MRRILSERNLVVVLFLLALVISVLAQVYTKRAEKVYMDAGWSLSSSQSPTQTAVIEMSETTVQSSNTTQASQ